MTSMGEEIREEVEWAIRRWRGEGVDSISESAAVDSREIRRATRAIGPFPGPGQGVTDGEVAAWIELRRAGASTEAIAAHFGVAATTVAHRTAGTGDYRKLRAPVFTPEQRERWIALRRERVTIRTIAAREGVTVNAVRTATQGAGPFTSYRRPPEGYVGVSALAAMCGVTPEATVRWRRLGYLPEPDSSHRGYPTWRVETVEEWIPKSGMEQCPECGAWSRAVAVHRGHVHGQ